MCDLIGSDNIARTNAGYRSRWYTVSMSQTDKLSNLLEYINFGVPPTSWYEAIPAIANERKLIEKELDKPEHHAYGFTTLLGPLDKVDADVAQQSRELLMGHLIGNPVKLPLLLSRAIMGTKMYQLSAGGSGISIEAYKSLLDIATNGSLNLVLDLNASYSSGDVVPGAQFLVSTLGENYNFQKGDLIALINGNFVSTGLFIHNYRHIKSIVNTLYPMLQRNNVKVWDNPPQDPVSTRDDRVYIDHYTSALDEAHAVINRNLSKFSGNPLFVDGIANSQNSFLNFGVTDATLQLKETVKLLGSMLQRRSDIYCQPRVDGGSIAHVQFCKVIEGYRQYLDRPYNTMYSGVMSGGVEDLWDNSLRLNVYLREDINTLNDVISIYESMG